FAVAVTSRSATAARRMRIAGLTSATRESSSGTTVISTLPLLPNTAIAVTRPLSVIGAERARLVPSAAARAGVIPGRRRATAWNLDRFVPLLPGVTGGGT